MPRVSRPRPVDLCPTPWPEVSSEDSLGEFGRQFVLRLRSAIGSRSLRSVALEAEVNPQTLANVLAGLAWPDLATVARLQMSLRVTLVPGSATWRGAASSK